MAELRIYGKTILSFFILCVSVSACAQDTAVFEDDKAWHFGIQGSVVKDFGSQANYFRGLNSFGLRELLSIPQVASELLTKTGKVFTLNEYPSPMRYNVGLAVGLSGFYTTGDVNYCLSAAFCKLNTTGIFTLTAENPNNPAGEEIIKTESITGTERRTWIKAGVQFKNEINTRNDFLIELMPCAYFQKAVSNTVNIEGSTYSILVNNPANAQVQTSFFGYGLSAGLGIQTLFIKNKLSQLIISFSATKLNMVKVNKLNYAAELCLGVFL